jgi:hypothetical protein
MCRWTWSAIAALVISIFGLGIEEQSSMPADVNQAIDFGDWSKTQSVCNQILQKNPDHPEALIARARHNY